jgi:hypothetical protein
MKNHTWQSDQQGILDCEQTDMVPEFAMRYLALEMPSLYRMIRLNRTTFSAAMQLPSEEHPG